MLCSTGEQFNNRGLLVSF